MTEGFSNSVIGGEGTLVRPQIASPNFNIANPAASPTPSWAVLKNGLAYIFGLVLSGGTITGPDYIINPSGAFFYTGTPALGNLAISIVPGTVSVTDPEGNTAPPGITLFGGLSLQTENGGVITTQITPGGDFFAFNSHGNTIALLAAGNGGGGGLFAYADAGAAQGPIIASIASMAGTDTITGAAYLNEIASYGSSGGTQFASQLGNGNITFWTAPGPGGPWASKNDIGQDASLNLILQSITAGIRLLGTKVSLEAPVTATAGTAASPSVIETDVWHMVGAAGEPAFSAGFAAGSPAPRFRMYPDKTVRLAGRVSVTAAVGAFAQIFQLPAAYQPASEARNLTANSLSGYTPAAGSLPPSVIVFANGSVEVNVAGANGNFVDLENITFALD